MITSYKNIEQYYEISVIDEVGDFVTGLTIQYIVNLSSDNSFITSGYTTETDNVYHFNYTFTNNGDYRLKFITPTYYDNFFDTITVLDKFATNIDLSGITIDVADVWSYSARTLTESSITPNDIWSYSARTLTESESGITAADVWNYVIDNKEMGERVVDIETSITTSNTLLLKIEKWLRYIIIKLKI